MPSARKTVTPNQVPADGGEARRSAAERGPARRRYDSTASREALLAAATRLFDERGYDATTIREIGELAGVDPSLIKRYFGSKERLYIAVLGQARRPAGDLDPRTLLARLLNKSDNHQINPMTLAMVSPTLDEPVKTHVRTFIDEQLTRPLTEWLDDSDSRDAALRAELIAAISVGVALARDSDTMPVLKRASSKRIQALLAPVYESLRTRPANAGAERG
jgi:AcrR family transcriptional regulator